MHIVLSRIPYWGRGHKWAHLSDFYLYTRCFCSDFYFCIANSGFFYLYIICIYMHTVWLWIPYWGRGHKWACLLSEFLPLSDHCGRKGTWCLSRESGEKSRTNWQSMKEMKLRDLENAYPLGFRRCPYSWGLCL